MGARKFFSFARSREEEDGGGGEGKRMKKKKAEVNKRDAGGESEGRALTSAP